MTLMNVIAMLVWTAAGAVLLFLLMWIDSLFTKYKDLTEMRNGNVAVTTRFIMKLFAQGYILSQSISKANDLWQALLASVVSFFILFVLELLVEWLLKKTVQLDLDQGAKEGKVAYALLAGSLHIVGALILAACL
ncbi:DUF350 domain-containing protein [Aneurinibacillus aneurinilyticus]|uniref:DUF350 domain-containing protein n=2 Tax=Aneurinibacillus aneurinilyticus TaxID=1391 RepID=A0A848CN68_ANEAE|nr:DUF350 domain-containing protein [Aneurinibacillus aneurinilyticus]MED0672590.1 DUF350 domain-containing protein [Aneurinibacillus aneurinilyticus]MED0708394.1 DUF350 domain-containing protein [Aneurinibacillus aneurinilyticus]MED0722539.1 DUF350 domain-containing protein [Aneurinibacillus aneurinilyticus]MED0732472.1 DUF350 domain-containing protein [Aneurinibacillus aneurinilyticus]MED0741911.1 DUF350 domain-containing protein [Aneurinibacillus aneurinilyticus]